MKIKDITDYLETIAPLSLQESYDNSGLIVGDKNWTVKKILITLDSTEEVIDEAIREKCNLVIAHHPIVFKGIKKLNGKNYVERVLIKAIKNNIAIYAIHTNYDNVSQGVNAKICERIGLVDCQILAPKTDLLKKLCTYIPTSHKQRVADAVFAAGAGNIGNYSQTSFNITGLGTFKGNEKSKPVVGKKNILEVTEEVKFETIFPAYLQSQVIQALLAAHPYEEVAFDIISLSNSLSNVGSGMIGNLKKPVDALTFLKSLKKNLNTEVIRHTGLLKKQISRVAVCGGAGSFLLPNAIGSGADIFITADFKYHEFFDAEDKLIVADVGHYESEQFTKELIKQHISEKFPIIAALISSINTNPVKYI